MATYDQAGPAGGALPKRNLANTANWAGALVSLALIAGVGVWGYKLLVRDVSGVPVVLATDGPMRIAPKDPGGEAADHQGLSVNDVAGNGTAAAPSDTLTLAPRPVELSGDDLPLGEITPLAPLRPRDSMTNATLSQETDQGGGLTAISPVAPAPMLSDDPVQALADQIAAGIEPIFTSPAPQSAPVVTALSDEPQDDETADAALETEEPLLSEQSAIQGGVARSLRPRIRPNGLRTVSLAPAASAPEQSAELDPDSLPGGTRLVQLGAFDSPTVARSEWARLETRFGDYLDGKSRVIQRATSGGRVFYRLRAHGFEDISDARRFCAAFVAENADCIPVVSR